MNIEIIRNTLYKAYLEAFYAFCKKLGGTTADTMCEILAVSNPASLSSVSFPRVVSANCRSCSLICFVPPYVLKPKLERNIFKSNYSLKLIDVHS